MYIFKMLSYSYKIIDASVESLAMHLIQLLDYFALHSNLHTRSSLICIFSILTIHLCNDRRYNYTIIKVNQILYSSEMNLIDLHQLSMLKRFTCLVLQLK